MKAGRPKKGDRPEEVGQEKDFLEAEDPALVREVEKLARNSPVVRYARNEVERQEMLVEDLMIQGTQPARMRQILQGQGWPKISKTRVDLLVERVRERWIQERAKTRDADREAAVRRITRFRTWAAGERSADGKSWVEKPNHAAIVQYERILMDLQGTREPLKIDITATYTEAMLAVVARLEGDEASKLLDEAREQERLANVARKMLPSAVIDVPAEVP